ncbi:MAG: hypothetical protein JXR88_10545 [Clostridia bacterium]|nr:hypothetical protein [Clostridia bacterium]
MFEKFRWKMTAIYTLLLVFILVIGNLLVFELLKSSNANRLNEEINDMLSNINSSQWIEESSDSEDQPHVEVALGNESDENDHEDSHEKDDSDEDEIEVEATTSNYKDIIIPTNLLSFSYYAISSNSGEILLYKVPNETVGNILYSYTDSLVDDMDPQIIDISKDGYGYYLMAKMPITINEEIIGYATVGQNITLVYDTLDQLFKVMLMVIAVGSIFAFIIGYFLADKMIKPIKQAYLTKKQFIGDASHELRTPLSAMTLGLDVLRLDQEKLSEMGQQTVESLQDETEKMSNLVERLLFIARNDASQTVYEQNKVDIKEIFTKKISHFESLAKLKNIKIEMKISESLWTIGDEKMLDSVASILLDNGIKYNKENGHLLIMGSVIKYHGKPFIEFFVEDTGIGIPKEDYNQVFERFHRQDVARSKKLEGFGLGLSIAKDIVKAHHGFIEIVSELNLYTRITIRLPKG